MAGFPSQPDRLVGRTGVMTRASAALADESGIPGVLLHGMPGAGKTACTLELAYTHEHAFDRLVWYRAPGEGIDVSGAFTDFALTLERYLEDFQMAHVVGSEKQLTDFLPRLTELMEQRRLLIAIDNAESLLTTTGQWRDERWKKVFVALTSHRGLGRVIMTSRRVFAEAPGLCVEAVDALSADEALLLARELPHLKNLIYGEVSGIEKGVARRLALGVLDVAQGHPTLLELADGQVAHPERLAKLIEAGKRAWQDQGGLPDGFFTTGETSADPSGYLPVLTTWTKSVIDALSPGERDLFWFLCCLEEPDREQVVLDNIWERLREELGRKGQPPALDKSLDALITQGLVSIQAGTGGRDESYAIHPVVAASGQEHAGKTIRDTC